ncbi:Non-specific serine/threonine protein kinase [Quillaja saponaria]|uniref:Non-specific serine/threonine protein kinase n=1 Tax=Quillaja saponaria TaxID=32244 RepID=A0AAD7QDH0_QUISA|nr:Non-specific serine/threonine protein kinase [Quillaja saponaria]
MGFPNNVGNYQLSRTIEGTFAKVKLSTNTTNDQFVAIKVIDKQMIMESNLKYQATTNPSFPSFSREKHDQWLRHCFLFLIFYTWKLYISGAKRDKNNEASASTQYRTNTRDYRHKDKNIYCYGICVRRTTLKQDVICKEILASHIAARNLLLDSKGNLKGSNFGLSALQKPGDLLTIACCSPSYVAPELLVNKGYDAAAADICREEYAFPLWFTESQKKLISRILKPQARKRITKPEIVEKITIPEIVEDEWFQRDYLLPCGYGSEENIHFDDVSTAFDSIEVKYQQMARYNDVIRLKRTLIFTEISKNLHGPFEEQDHKKSTRLGSTHKINETIKKIESAAMDMKMHSKQKMTRCSRSYLDLSTEVIEVAPTHCVVKIPKSAGELGVYTEFCKSLSSLLTQKSNVPSQTQDPEELHIRNENNRVNSNLKPGRNAHRSS